MRKIKKKEEPSDLIKKQSHQYACRWERTIYELIQHVHCSYIRWVSHHQDPIRVSYIFTHSLVGAVLELLASKYTEQEQSLVRED